MSASRRQAFLPWRAVCWLFLGVPLLPVSSVSADTLLVEAGSKSAWKYQDNGSEPAADWRELDFDDSSWKTGRAPFGYGEPDVTTQIGYGENAAHKTV